MEQKQHLHTLDLLRGLAALSVVLFHYSSIGLRKFSFQENAQLFYWGHYGVEVFFVISGFIIPYVLHNSNYRLSHFGRFLGKRFIRISGPAYAALLLTLLQYFLIDYLHLSDNAWFTNITLVQVLHNFTFTIPFTHYSWINFVFWTLAVEFQYYLLIGLLFGVMFRTLQGFIICSLLLSSLYWAPFSQQAELFAYSSLFIIGGITFLLFQKRISLLQYTLLLLAAGVICMYQQNLLSALFGISTSLLICFVQVKNRVSAFLGKISYSLYLTHILIGLTLEGLLIKLFPQPSVPVMLIVFVFSASASIVGAYLFHKLVEVHFISLSNKIFSRHKTEVTQPASV